MAKSIRGRKKKSPKKKSPKICKPIQELNPITNRCNLKCKNGMERRPSNFKCRKSCIPPQIRNVNTDRCKKPPNTPIRKRRLKNNRRTPRRNPVRLVRKQKSPIVHDDCPVCLEPTYQRTFCTSGRRHPLCRNCYYHLLGVGIHYCPICKEYMTRPPAI